MITVSPSTPETIVDLLNDVGVWTCAANLQTMQTLLAGSYAFTVADDCEPIGAYALKAQSLDNGVVAWLIAGQGRAAQIDLTAGLLPEIENQCDGANFLAIQTIRPGLIRKLCRQGYTMAGVIMVKELKQ